MRSCNSRRNETNHKTTTKTPNCKCDKFHKDAESKIQALNCEVTSLKNDNTYNKGILNTYKTQVLLFGFILNQLSYIETPTTSSQFVFYFSLSVYLCFLLGYKIIYFSLQAENEKLID